MLSEWHEFDRLQKKMNENLNSGLSQPSVQYASPMDALLNSALSLRGVWILDEQRQKVLFSRRFTTVEKRALELIRAQHQIGMDESSRYSYSMVANGFIYTMIILLLNRINCFLDTTTATTHNWQVISFFTVISLYFRF